MKRLKAIGCCVLAAAMLAAPPAFAQQPQTGATIHLKDGKSVTTSRVRRAGSSVMASVQVGGSAGEVGYSLTNIARIDFPQPPELKQARDFIAQGKMGEAIGVLRAVLDGQLPFADVPGNWWQTAAQLKLNALAASGRDAEVEALIKQLAQSSTDPDTIAATRVQQAASWTRKGQHEKALAVYDAVLKEAKNRDTLATAWLNKGHSLLALHRWEPAILSYLQVPVFYSNSKLLVPQALLGSARAMTGLQDVTSASAKYNEIIETFPASPEAATAKSELEKLEKKKS